MKKSMLLVVLLTACIRVLPGQGTGNPLGVAWGFTYGYPPDPPVEFMPELRELGIGWTKVYLFWHQLEPENDRFEWEAVDALLEQIEPGEEVLVAVFSASTWATKTASEILPPSPAKSAEDYYDLIFRLVSRCKGKIRYWQNDCEPNNPVYWNGTSEEFIGQLRVFHRAVRDADPDARVVIGGYDGLFNPPGSWPFDGQEKGLAFFRKAITEASDCFDLFDIRLYADPYTIPYRVEYFRRLLDESGKGQPVICTEYNGPGFFEYSQNLAYVDLVREWQASISSGELDSLSRLHDPLKALYDRINALDPQTRMFMMGCDPELEEKYYRIQSRDIVMRNLLAFASGVESTLYWDLWHDTRDTFNLMTLMYGKHKLVEFDRGDFTRTFPQAGTFAVLNNYLGGFTGIRRIEISETPLLYLFEISRGNGETVYAAWERHDSFAGEDLPPRSYKIPWDGGEATATTLFGENIPLELSEGTLSLQLSVDPVFIESIPD
jgi:hypothetical protein